MHKSLKVDVRVSNFAQTPRLDCPTLGGDVSGGVISIGMHARLPASVFFSAMRTRKFTT
jgi:hypothetical protein